MFGIGFLALSLLLVGEVAAFTPFKLHGTNSKSVVTTRFASLQEPPKKDKPAEFNDEVQGSQAIQEPNADGLPWWWELVWKLDIMKQGEPGKEIIFGDSANVLRTNIEQIYGGYPSLDGCPLAEGKESQSKNILWHPCIPSQHFNVFWTFLFRRTYGYCRRNHVCGLADLSNQLWKSL